MALRIAWPFIEIGAFAIAFVLPVLLVRYVKWPHQWGLRALAATLICWIGLIVYALAIYFPVGIARAEYLGSKELERSFDNNNFVPILLTGWVNPALVLGAIALWRWFLRNYGDPKLSTK